MRGLAGAWGHSSGGRGESPVGGVRPTDHVLSGDVRAESWAHLNLTAQPGGPQETVRASLGHGGRGWSRRDSGGQEQRRSPAGGGGGLEGVEGWPWCLFRGWKPSGHGSTGRQVLESGVLPGRAMSSCLTAFRHRGALQGSLSESLFMLFFSYPLKISNFPYVL